LEEGLASNLDPKVIAAYKSIGAILKTYKSGKLPKAFKIIP
jgi:essential nuclear protein 1